MICIWKLYILNFASCAHIYFNTYMLYVHNIVEYCIIITQFQLELCAQGTRHKLYTFLPVCDSLFGNDVMMWHPARVAGCSPHENGDGQPESPPPRSCLSRCHLRQWTWTTSQVTSTFLTTRCPSRRKQLWSTQGVERPYRRWPTFHSICLSPAQPVAAARCWPTA